MVTDEQAEPCEHETTMRATTGDGVEVVRCADCGALLHMGDYPWPDEAARPTADLGEDGELIRELRTPSKWCCIFEHEGEQRHGTTDAPFRAADRLILYREALAKADKCGSCDKPRSSYCATCERDWQS
jgi:hypothetical protein